MRRAPTLPIALAGSAAFFNLYATQPLLPLLQRTFGATRFDVGLTITAPTVAVALFAPLIGRLADSMGLRRVIVVSAFLLAATTAGAATSASLRQLILWRFLQGLVTPGVFAGAIAYIHETWPASRVGRAMAAYMIGTIVGGFIGRASAGLIASDLNWHASFIVLGALSLAVAVSLLAWLPPEPVTAHLDHPPGGQGSGFLPHMRNGQLLATYLIGFCVLFTNVAMFTYIPFYLAAAPFRLGTAALGWLFVVYLVGAIITPLGGWWVDKYGHRFGLGSAMAIGATGAFLTLAHSLPAIVAGLALTCTGVFIAQTTTSSYIGAVTTAERGLAVGLYSTFYYTGGSVGGVAPAAFWNLGGWPGCVALIVVVQLLGAGIALTFWKNRSKGLRYDYDAVEPVI